VNNGELVKLRQAYFRSRSTFVLDAAGPVGVDRIALPARVGDHC
jgi:hypothetical protein